MENENNQHKEEAENAPSSPPELPDPAAAPDSAEDSIISFSELQKGLEYQEKLDEMLLGAQDPSVCTYPEGYKPRQTLYTCLTCTPEPQMAGVCYGCSLHCHDGHHLIELFTKRKFQCDCGNSKFGEKKCTLYEEKDAENKYNSYNHNYNGKFCTCDVFYPDDDQNCEFFQCEVCEDWFHETHLELRTIKQEEPVAAASSTDPSTSAPESHAKDPYSSIICLCCVKKLPFLLSIPTGKGPFCHTKAAKPETALEPIALEIEKFRERLCKCPDCTRVYEAAECDFLLDDEDDIGTFEKESKKKAEENKITPEQEMRGLVTEFGMEGAQVFYSGLNNFKTKFLEFMNNREDREKAVTADDVNTFYNAFREENQAKRPRYE